MKVYKLTVPIDKIIQHYEEMENSESARTMQAIQKLKEMAAT
jgi:predicted transcriptional regulator